MNLKKLALALVMTASLPAYTGQSFAEERPYCDWQYVCDGGYGRRPIVS